MENLNNWLVRYGLSDLTQKLTAHDIDLQILRRLTREDMVTIGLTVGDMYRLKDAISTHFESDHARSEHFRRLTVLYSDLVDSTGWVNLLDPEPFRSMLLAYQTTVETVMDRFGGTITRYEGDGLQVLFGYPQAYENGAERAVSAALKSVLAVSKLRAANRPLQSRVGVATGEVVVGDLILEGNKQRLMISGDAPHLAKRLQEFKGPDSVVISAPTYTMVENSFHAKALPPREAKGYKNLVASYWVNAIKPEHLRKNNVAEVQLVARQIEIEQLHQLWINAKKAHGKAALVSGEAGIGKTRLLEEFSFRIPSQEIVRLNCLSTYQNSMLMPVLHYLRELVGSDDSKLRINLENHVKKLTGSDEAVTSSLSALLQFLLDSAEEPDRNREIELDREEMFHLLLVYLSALVSNGVSVLIVEDLHWADPSTLELIERIVQSLADQPLMVLATSRAEFVPDFASFRNVAMIKLMPFTYRESIALIRRFCKLEMLPDADIRKIADRCDGVPLYLQEVTRAVLAKVDVSVLDISSTSIPDTLRDLLMARLDRLGEVSELVQTASVLGRQFSVSQLTTVSALVDQEQIMHRLKALISAGVITQKSFESSVIYQFNHALTANAAYASLLPSDKQKIHGKIAKMLDADPDAVEREPETAAYHYEWAGNLEKAIALRQLAGNRSSARSANKEAAFHFTTAVSLACRLPEGDENSTRQKSALELNLRLQLGTQLIACHGNAAPEVEKNFKRAQVLCETVPDEYLRWQTFYGLWSYHIVDGRLRDAKENGSVLLDIASRLKGNEVPMTSNRAQGLCLFAMGEFTQSQLHLERAVALYNPALHDLNEFQDISNCLVLAKCNLAWLYCFQGKTKSGIRLHKEAIAHAEGLKDHHSLAFALALTSASYQAFGDLENTKRSAHRLVQHSVSQGYPYWQAWGQMLLAWSQAGESTELACKEFNLGLEAYQATGARMMNAYFLTLQAELMVADGQFYQAREILDRAENFCLETAVEFYAPEIERLRGVIFFREGLLDNAQEKINQARAKSEAQGNQLLLAKVIGENLCNRESTNTEINNEFS